jgi:hypothetical protein
MFAALAYGQQRQLFPYQVTQGVAVSVGLPTAWLDVAGFEHDRRFPNGLSRTNMRTNKELFKP